MYSAVFLCLFWDFGPESNSRVNKRQAFIPKQHKSTARERESKRKKGDKSMKKLIALMLGIFIVLPAWAEGEGGAVTPTDSESGEQSGEPQPETTTNSIKIATTAYNNNAFSPVQTALNTAIDNIKDVVSNTINQATAVANLQSGKQTMPDSTATNGTCPNYRQCLLVEDESGTPHWYVITDPFRDFVTTILANNSTIPAVDAQRRYAGDLDLCRMLPQTDDEATNTGIAKCTGVANYQNSAAANTVRGSALKQTEWGYEFKAADLANNPNNDSGIVYGISKCVSTEIPSPGYAKPATDTHLKHALWDARPTTMAEADKYRRCWCKTTGISYGGQYYETSAAPWVFRYTSGSAAVCAYDCAYVCARDVRYIADFRSAVLGFAAN